MNRISRNLAPITLALSGATKCYAKHYEERSMGEKNCQGLKLNFARPEQTLGEKSSDVAQCLPALSTWTAGNGNRKSSCPPRRVKSQRIAVRCDGARSSSLK